MDAVTSWHYWLVVVFLLLLLAGGFAVLRRLGYLRLGGGSLQWGWYACGVAIIGLGLWVMRLMGLGTSQLLLLSFVMFVTLLSLLSFQLASDRQRALLQARESEERYRLALEGSNDAFWDWDIKNNRIFWSDRLFDILGIQPLETVTVETFFEYLHPGDQQQVWLALKRHLNEGTPFEVEFRMQHVSGGYRDCLQRGRASRNDRGEPVRMSGVLTDTTVRKSVERLLMESRRELQHYAARLEASNQELDQFASMASHDLKAPLRKIISFLGAMRKNEATLSPQSLEYIARIERSAEKMQGLIDDLLSLSRVTSREQKMERLALGPMVAEVLSDHAERVAQQQAQVYIGDLPEIQGERTLIYQLFSNLVDNALKYSRDGVPPEIRIVAEAAVEGQCTIHIRDNGIGFEQENVRRIFFPFERLHGEGKYPGTGIGLAICKKIAEKHGGSITATSQPGQGTEFLVHLPVAEVPTPSPAL